jgi:nucleosome binding factor SPN SPT16 subunit
VHQHQYIAYILASRIYLNKPYPTTHYPTNTPTHKQQSGGVFDIKVSAQSNQDNLSPDVILCSLGARYKGYCASISRTFMVDVPNKVERTYAILLGVYSACIESMVVGKELKDVLEAAKTYLKQKDASLLAYLPKSLGFVIGLEFRDASLVLNSSNSTKFSAGMVFQLSVGLHNVPLVKDEKKGASAPCQKLDVFSLLLADMVAVVNDGVPDVLTKSSKEFTDVSYSISGGDKDGDDDVVEIDGDDDKDGVRRSERSKDEKMANATASNNREKRQRELMEKKLKEGRKKMARVEGDDNGDDEQKVPVGKELTTYASIGDYPSDVSSNRLMVDLAKEALLIPINGHTVPFHISTIKNMTQPDPEMRINFYIPGVALGKEV